MKKRILLLFLALLTASLPACGSTTETTDTAAETDTAAAAEEIPVETTVTDTVTADFGSYDYEGYSFPLMGMNPGGHWYNKISETANEIWYEGDSGDLMSSAVYQRNLLTEELLNIRITPVWGGQSGGDLSALVKKNVLAGDAGCDAYLSSMTYSITLSMEGLLLPFQETALNLSNPWWDPSIVSNYTMPGNQLFVLAGHYNSYDDYAVANVFYNEAVLHDVTETNPVELVREGKWTIDAMMELAELAARDVDGNGKMDKLDAWGFMDNEGTYNHLQAGFGYTIVEKNGDEYRYTLEDEYVVNALEKLYNVVMTSPAQISIVNADCRTAFSENRCLFYYEMLGGINQMRDMEADFCLVPLPKIDESQESYTSSVNPVWCTSLSIPQTVSDADRTGVILDVLGGYSTDTVNKILYELMLGSKLVRNAETVEMLELVMASKVYDLGALSPMTDKINPLFAAHTARSGFVFVSRYASAKKAAETALTNFLASFTE